MNITEARQLADAALAKAKELDKLIAVCVVDSAGWIVLAENHSTREAFATYSAECKAVTSAVMGRDSVDFINTMERYPFLNAPMYDRLQGRMLAMGGGAILKRGDTVVGGLGIAGSGAETDHQIAKAAANQFFDEFVWGTVTPRQP